ncbi:CPBP family intramembrane glutamic endopeptidase [Arthrobacter sp. PAMC25284]|uniref:CPBP family intramembrane glutamic endopeptidase n=1 Tax=Arthrobacter sp. PAMC25284 TaxID=2861279 RepID=UPI001C638405|nr:CPBP family intramembrane metalloprotease [Arthrobacter sp. PAMC25284]
MVAGATLHTPLWDEAVFRGVIHGGLRHRFGPLIAGLLSAVLFAVVHGQHARNQRGGVGSHGLRGFRTIARSRLLAAVGPGS